MDELLVSKKGYNETILLYGARTLLTLVNYDNELINFNFFDQPSTESMNFVCKYCPITI